MKSILDFLQSSVGKKILMSLTGLFLCSFLLVHLAGNFLLFKEDGGAAFNQYSDFMKTNFIIRTLEIGLFGGLLLHMISGVIVWWQNKQSRPKKYSVYKLSDNSPLESRITMVTGSVIFLFLVVHLRTFFVPVRILGENVSMYELVRTAFADPVYDLFYIVALVLLGYHLRHGFQAAFQTLGLRTKKYLGILQCVAAIFWLIVPLGFASMPIYFYFLQNSGGVSQVIGVN